jgi:hypothetical protein
MRIDAGGPTSRDGSDLVFAAFNGSSRSASFTLPHTPGSRRWLQVLDTGMAVQATPGPAPQDWLDPGQLLRVDGPGVVVCVTGAIAIACRAAGIDLGSPRA